jgi:hypothetical protein
MSFITPSKYREIANQVGLAYKTVRDSLISGDGTNAADYAENAVKKIVEYPDDTSTDIAPIGSIANDLGAVSFDFNQKFSTTNAKSLASAYFSQIISSLNAHVIRRSAADIYDIKAYYAKYKSLGSAAEVCFYTNGIANSINESYYFSEDFEELIKQLNISINTDSNNPDIYVGDSVIIN